MKQLPVNKIIRGDALEVLKALPDKCVDLVFCSPPYEDARYYDISFKIKGQAWVDWAFERYVECVRICKGLVAWVIEGRTRKFQYSATPLLLAADLHRAGIKLRKPPIYNRVGIPGSGGPDWLRNDYEFIICATHGKLPWSDNTACGKPPKWAPGGEMSYRLSNGSRVNQWGGTPKKKAERKRDGLRGNAERPSHVFGTKKSNRRKPNGVREVQAYQPPAIANPGNLINCKVGGGQMGSQLAHENEAPFPEELAEFFVRSFCPSNGIALDPFCGSGTTMAVAEKLNRRWIGIDIRQSQVELCERRINEAKQEAKELFE